MDTIPIERDGIGLGESDEVVGQREVLRSKGSVQEESDIAGKVHRMKLQP